MLAGTAAVLILLVGGFLASCAGPRQDALDARAAELADTHQAKSERLAEVEPDSAEADALRAELASLRAELLELQAKRAKATAEDTLDVGADLLWSAVDVLLLGGAGAYAYRRRSKSRKAELGEVHARLDALESTP